MKKIDDKIDWKWREKAREAAKRFKKRVGDEFDTWKCDFEPTGKCRWIGFLRYPPSEYGLYCVCCRILSLEEAVRDAGDDVRGALKVVRNALTKDLVEATDAIVKVLHEVSSAMEELSVLLLKLPTEAKK